MTDHYQVAVLGLGAMGSAAIYQLAKRGIKVLGVDQFSPPHTLGSTHGDTRITRQAIGEGSEYVPLVLRSYEIWEEIEKDLATKLLFKVGGLIMSSEQARIKQGENGFLKTTIKAAEQYGIAHELLDTMDIKKRFPQFAVNNQEQAYFEYNAGYLIPELCVEAQLRLAKQNGATINTNIKVTNWTVSAMGEVILTTADETYTADRLVITAGPWIGELLPKKYSQIFKVYRQVLHWFEFDQHNYLQLSPPKMPVFIWEFGADNEQAMYGFPAVDGATGGLKVAGEQYDVSTYPDKVNRAVDQTEVAAMYKQYIQKNLPLLKPESVKACSCLYTVSPDHGFIIDMHPEFEQVIIASPCSGHGFKHSAAIGEVLAELATTGEPTVNISAFSMKRFM